MRIHIVPNIEHLITLKDRTNKLPHIINCNQLSYSNSHQIFHSQYSPNNIINTLKFRTSKLSKERIPNPIQILQSQSSQFLFSLFSLFFFLINILFHPNLFSLWFPFFYFLLFFSFFYFFINLQSLFSFFIHHFITYFIFSFLSFSFFL